MANFGPADTANNIFVNVRMVGAPILPISDGTSFDEFDNFAMMKTLVPEAALPSPGGGGGSLDQETALQLSGGLDYLDDHIAVGLPKPSGNGVIDLDDLKVSLIDYPLDDPPFSPGDAGFFWHQDPVIVGCDIQVIGY